MHWESPFTIFFRTDDDSDPTKGIWDACNFNHLLQYHNLHYQSLLVGWIRADIVRIVWQTHKSARIQFGSDQNINL